MALAMAWQGPYVGHKNVMERLTEDMSHQQRTKKRATTTMQCVVMKQQRSMTEAIYNNKKRSMID
jgi:hypothetical protein